MSTKAQKRWMGKVAELGCIVCRNAGFGPTPAQVHHLREGQGGAQRANDFLTIPLCPAHHDGKDSIHKDRQMFQARYGTELDLLSQTIGEVFGGKVT